MVKPGQDWSDLEAEILVFYFHYQVPRDSRLISKGSAQSLEGAGKVATMCISKELQS